MPRVQSYKSVTTEWELVQGGGSLGYREQNLTKENEVVEQQNLLTMIQALLQTQQEDVYEGKRARQREKEAERIKC